MYSSQRMKGKDVLADSTRIKWQKQRCPAPIMKAYVYEKVHFLSYLTSALIEWSAARSVRFTARETVFGAH